MRWLACGLAAGLFAWNAAFFYFPGQGFTHLIEFGAMEHERYLPELKAVNHYEVPKSPGYDSQWYAQIAMRPRLADPVLKKAVDGLSYRARRILFPLIAWALAWGNPARAMHIFAAENLVCWYLLALLLFHWFPPVSWGNVARWAAVLFSFGMIFSVTRALLDGPSLLLVASGMALVEARRPWLAAMVLGLSSFGRETNILSGAGMEIPRDRATRAWATWLLRAAVVVVPLLAWVVCLRLWLGKEDDVGARNLAMPFAGLANKLEDIVARLGAEGYDSVAKFDLLVVVGLMAQFFFFAFRRRWQDPWWRLGASYAVLMAFLGDAVWEAYPSAAARVLLPMTLAFNIRVPRGRWWIVLLLVGNLGVIASVDISKPPGKESYIVVGPRDLRINPKGGDAVGVIYGPRNWWTPEKSRWSFWRWNQGDATITIHNPQPFTLMVWLRFHLRPIDERKAIVLRGGSIVWQGQLEPSEVKYVSLKGIDLPPGDTVFVFKSDRPAGYPGNGDQRRLSFSLRDLELDLKGRR